MKAAGVSASPSPRSMLVPNRRNLVLMGLGAALYGLAAWITNVFPISTGAGIDIRPGVAIPLFFGFAFGPVVGFVSGFAGNLLGDALSGYVQVPPAHASGNAVVDVTRGLIITWQIGNGLLGLVTGLAALSYHRYVGWRDQARALGVSALAVLAGAGFASLADVAVYHEVTLSYAVGSYFLPAARTNLISAALLVPLLLFNYARLDVTSTDWTRSVLLRRMVLAITLSALLPVALLALFLTQVAAGAMMDATEVAVRLALTAVVSLALAVSNASLVALSVWRPLLRLTDAAREMEAGRFTPEQAAELARDAGHDEVGRLSGLFGTMAAEVIARESRLRQQVQALRIEIDEARKQREVAKVTETDYFRGLQRRAKDLRQRGVPPAGEPVFAAAPPPATPAATPAAPAGPLQRPDRGAAPAPEGNAAPVGA